MAAAAAGGPRVAAAGVEQQGQGHGLAPAAAAVAAGGQCGAVDLAARWADEVTGCLGHGQRLAAEAAGQGR